MPEGPEVKLTAEYLNKQLENKIITNWVFLKGGQYSNKEPKGFEEFYASLPLLVDEVRAKGKIIYICCFNEFRRFYIIHSLRMTGRWQEYKDEQCKWYIEVENKRKIWFRNPRCLATLHFTQNEHTFNTTLSSLGPDIMTKSFNLNTWRTLVSKYPNRNVTSFLMDQKVMSGCGNYIKAEVLYYAKISPLRKMKTLKEKEIEKLFEGLRIIPRLSYNYRGLSTKEYTDEKGKKGHQEFKLKIYRKPYATQTRTCDGRITHWDPKVQK